MELRVLQYFLEMCIRDRLAKAAKELQNTYPGIHYHISSGNAEFVVEQLDKGLIDFGIVFGQVDQTRYNSLKMPTKDIWGVLMRRDSALAQKETIAPEDLWDKPLIISHQRNQGKELSAWMKRDISKLNVVATYNPVSYTHLPPGPPYKNIKETTPHPRCFPGSRPAVPKTAPHSCAAPRTGRKLPER